MSDLAKIVQELREFIEKHIARFRIEGTKYTIVMFEKDCVKLVQDGF